LSKLKKYGKELWYFLSSGIFLRNFLGMVGTVVLFLFLTMYWMKCYTKHGESLQVHDYVGMQLEDAIKKAKKRSFNLVVNDSISRPELPPGQIMDQKPKPLSRVKEDRTIYLQITKTVLDKKKLPGLVGNYNYRQYTNKLARLGLKGTVKERVFNQKYEENTILHLYYKGNKITDEDIKKGVSVPDGSTLEFVVTERGGTMVDMPQLVCMKYSEARFLLSNYSLNIGSLIPDATVRREDDAFIWRQKPAFDPQATIRMGTQIDLYLTQYRPDDCR